MKLLFYGLSLILPLLQACGSNSGSDTASIVIIEPNDDQSFQAGSSIHYLIATPNFTLNIPPSHASLSRQFSKHGDGDGHDDEVSSEQDSAETMTDQPTDSSEMTEDDHHASDDTNPSASVGHYHVYLDDASGTDPHLTAWTEEGDFELPTLLDSGTHSLRFELRDDQHIPLGTPSSEAIIFFEVP